MVERKPLKPAGAGAAVSAPPKPKIRPRPVPVPQQAVQTVPAASSMLDLERQYAVVRGQLVMDMKGLANVLSHAAVRIAAGDTPRPGGEYAELGRRVDAGCEVLRFLDRYIIRHK